MRELEYPFNSEYILKKSKSIRRLLLSANHSSTFLSKKIAVLGGSTTHDIIRILDLFLLNQGIQAEFYESEYGMYWQDIMFENEELKAFAPDLILIHTSNHNITMFPDIKDDVQGVEECISSQFEHFRVMWERSFEVYHCPVIQNNFEYPFYRIMGNADAYDIHGRIYFINRLNQLFADYAGKKDHFFLNDINYISAAYGLSKWADPFYWHMYKYCMCMQAVPEFAFNLSNIIKSIFGKNKKAMVLDLDNTLWGGIVGDDGAENLEIGQETSQGQVYAQFQSYIKAHKDLGIMLNINSKNELENALAGLCHPEGILKPEDFLLIKANWEPKSKNIEDIAKELNILPDSIVFVDDNPAERQIVREQIPGVSAPEMGNPEEYLRILDRSGFFEVTKLSEDDKNRNEMYQANLLRDRQKSAYSNYMEYLLSLEMKGTVKAFEPVYFARIAQLTNKSNQFNLTTRRYTQSEIEQAAGSEDKITLYGKLEDKFGDNGVVSVIIGHKQADQDSVLHIDLWIMSCRVLKRDMEFAMMDRLVEECKKAGISRIRGYYDPTAKNSMVKSFYDLQGFDKISESEQGNTVWQYDIPLHYSNKNKVISMIKL